MELHAVDEGVIVDRAGVCSASTKGLEIRLSRPSEILVCDRRERQQLDLVDLDHDETAPVDASDLYLWSRPEAVGDGDGSVRYSIADIGAELHAAFCRRTPTPTRGRLGRRLRPPPHGRLAEDRDRPGHLLLPFGH